MEKRELLIELLKKAADEMFAYGNRRTPWSSYKTCNDLGNFIKKAAERYERGDGEDLDELLGIFIPISDWDDSGGSADLGNQIYDLLVKIIK